MPWPMKYGVLAASGKGITFLLRDEFTFSASAGEVDGTLATDGVNLRTLVDVDGDKHQITNGQLQLTPLSTPSAGNPRITYPAVERALGRTLTGRYASQINALSLCGFMTTPGTAASATVGWNTLGISSTLGSRAIMVNRITQYIASNIFYQLSVILRASGFVGVVKHAGIHKFGHLSSYSNTASVFPQISPYASGYIYCDEVQIPETLWFPTPLASDSFDRADGAVGNTDGQGHAEANASLGSGGSGLAWAADVGACAIFSNKLAASTLNGGLAITTVDTGQSAVYVSAYLTRSAGTVGIVSRYVDANNYLYAIHNGTQVVVGKVVEGVDTNIVTTAATYRVGGELAMWCDGVDVGVIYQTATAGQFSTITNNTQVTDAILQPSGKVGIITTDTGNTADNFTVWPRYLTDFPFDITEPTTNVDSPLFTPTYDGSNQATHPSVYYNASGWNGYKYWMAMTPYPQDNWALENPSILVSHDGIAWYEPDGISNPIVPAPADPDGEGIGFAFYADPCLVMAPDDKLWLFYIYQEHHAGEISEIRCLSSTDGVTWSAETPLVSAGYREILSPAVVYDGSQYVMWYVDFTTNSVLKRTCATPDGTWSAPSTCTVSLPAGRQPWHISVARDGAGWKMYANLRVEPTAYGTELWIARSSDGETWMFDSEALINKSPNTQAWDSNRIYHASGIKMDNDWIVYYSARSNISNWHIGRMIE